MDTTDTELSDFPKGMIIAGTGHRPPRLGLDYSADSNRALTIFVQKVLNLLSTKWGVNRVISGMATGFDQALAHAAVRLNIPITCAIPFKGMESRWPKSGQERFNALLKRADQVVYIDEKYSKRAYIKRDHWMVDNANVVMSLFDGSPHGGTHETVQYAESKGLIIVPLWPVWERLLDKAV